MATRANHQSARDRPIVRYTLAAKWGLSRHYWVFVKFLISTSALLIQTQPINLLAGMTARSALSSAELSQPRLQLVVAAAAGLLVLLVALTLAVYKPRGLTPYGWRKQHEQRSVTTP